MSDPADMNKDADELVRQCREWSEGMQRRRVVSACLHRHVMAFLDECIERGSDLEDIQLCFAETARYIANLKPGETKVNDA